MKKIIFSIFAVAALLFTSCVKEPAHNGLDVLKVDKTFVAIDKLGGEATLTIKAEADWHIVDSVVVNNRKVAVVDSLTIAPKAGLKGETVVTFSSEARKKRVKTQLEIVCEGQSQFIVFSMEAGIPSPYPDFEAGEYWLMFKQADGTWLASKHCTATIDDAGSYGYVFCEPAQGTFPNLTSTEANVFTFELVDKEDPESGFVIKDVKGGYLYQDAAGKYTNFYRTSKKEEAMGWTVEQESDTEFRIESTQSKWIQYSTKHSSWGAYDSKQDGALLPYLVKAEKVLIDLEATSVVLENEDTTVVALAKINADQVSVDFDADWINYRGTNDKGFIFKVAANDGDARKAKVRFSASLTQKDPNTKEEKTYTQEVTLTIEQAGNVIDIEDIELNKPCLVQGQVTALCARGFILTDGTASVLYYQSSGFDPSAYKIGDTYTVMCSKVTSYGGAFQLDASNVTTLKKVSEGTYSYPTPKVMDKEALDAFVAKTDNGFGELITFTAKATISSDNKYYNYFINDGDTNGFSLYQGTDDQKALFATGETYTVTGYIISRSSSKYANFVLVSVAE